MRGSHLVFRTPSRSDNLPISLPSYVPSGTKSSPCISIRFHSAALPSERITSLILRCCWGLLLPLRFVLARTRPKTKRKPIFLSAREKEIVLSHQPIVVSHHGGGRAAAEAGRRVGGATSLVGVRGGIRGAPCADRLRRVAGPHQYLPTLSLFIIFFFLADSLTTAVWAGGTCSGGEVYGHRLHGIHRCRPVHHRGRQPL